MPKIASMPSASITAAWDKCVIAAGNRAASKLISSMAATMRLNIAKSNEPDCAHDSLCQLHVYVLNEWQFPAMSLQDTAVDDKNAMVCRLAATTDRNELALQMIWLSLLLVRNLEQNGAVLLHGALAEYQGMGVILAGPGGIGKTTASRRLSFPWRSLSDDMTLVVRSKNGAYTAHPWPTWSLFFNGGPGGRWDFHHSVPLAQICFLDQAPNARMRNIGGGQAAVLLQESAKQASIFPLENQSRDQQRILRLRRFENICSLTRQVPASILETSLTSSFWLDIEQLLTEKDEACRCAS